MAEKSVGSTGSGLNEQEKAAITAEYLNALRPRIEDGELMPLEVFLGVIGVMPVVSLECVMLRSNPVSGDTEVLLTPRDDDDPVWPGQLHVPGTVLRTSDVKHGTIGKAFERVFRDEVPGIQPRFEPQLIEPSVGNSGRSAGIGLVYLVRVEGTTHEGKFFSAANLPDDLIEFQRNFVTAAAQTYETE